MAQVPSTTCTRTICRLVTSYPSKPLCECCDCSR